MFKRCPNVRSYCTERQTTSVVRFFKGFDETVQTFAKFGLKNIQKTAIIQLETNFFIVISNLNLTLGNVFSQPFEKTATECKTKLFQEQI